MGHIRSCYMLTMLMYRART